MRTAKERAALALGIQNASNVVAVARTLGEFLSENRDPTDPANVLVLSKLASMLPYSMSCIGSITVWDDSKGITRDAFAPAYEACKRAAKGEG
jgi:hypothetical protein